MKKEFTREEVIKVIKYFATDFKLTGDEGIRQEKAEKIADELLRYSDHALWKVVEYRWTKLPCNRK